MLNYFSQSISVRLGCDNSIQRSDFSELLRNPAGRSKQKMATATGRINNSERQKGFLRIARIIRQSFFNNRVQSGFNQILD